MRRCRDKTVSGASSTFQTLAVTRGALIRLTLLLLASMSASHFDDLAVDDCLVRTGAERAAALHAVITEAFVAGADLVCVRVHPHTPLPPPSCARALV